MTILRRWPETIYARFLIATLLPLFSLCIALGGYMVASRQREIFQDLQEDALAATQYLAASSEFAMFSGDKNQLRGMANSILKIPDFKSVVFIDNTGEVVLQAGDTLSLPEVMPQLHEPDQLYPFRDIWYLYVPIISQSPGTVDFEEPGENEYLELGRVVVGITNRFLLNKQRESTRTALWVFGIGMLLAGFGSAYMAWTIARPARRLTLSVRKLQSGVSGERAEEVGPVEMRQLAAGINELADAVANSERNLQREVVSATSQLQKTLEELETASEAKDQFLARMSHELRTPLAAVIGFTRLLVKEPIREKRELYLARISSASRMLLHTIDDILEFSKTRSGQIKLESVPFDLRRTLQEVVDTHSMVATEKRLELKVEIQTDLCRLAVGDPTRFAQVFNNLLGNALKFTERGTVRLLVSQFQTDDNKPWLRGIVTDTGKGIAQSNIASLFTPFVQEDDSINRHFGGTGLGLAICKHLVELMGGQIRLESELGRGTRVTVELPLTEISSLDLSQSQILAGGDTSDALRGVTVLIAEDNHFNQELLKLILTAHGADCLVAEDGATAVELAENLFVDIVLMDIHMPGMDGITATSRIVGRSGESPRVIGLTADITQTECERMRLAGAAEVLLKPIDEKKLLESISAALKTRITINAEPTGLLAGAMPVEEVRKALSQNLHRIESAIQIDNSQLIRELMHDLLGMSGLFGMNNLRECVLEFRQNFKNHDLSGNIAAVNRIRETVESEIARILAEQNEKSNT